jgi:hypothetical protein
MIYGDLRLTTRGESAAFFGLLSSTHNYIGSSPIISSLLVLPRSGSTSLIKSTDIRRWTRIKESCNVLYNLC